MRTTRVFIVFIVTALFVAGGLPALAQATDTPSLTLSTPYSAVAVEPGHTVTFDLNLTAPEGDQITFDVGGAPDTWTTTIKGGGFVVDGVTYDPNHPPLLRLSVQVPDDATDGVQHLRVTATGQNDAATLDLTIRVAAQVGGGVSMTTDFPALKGPSGVKFSYRLRLKNDTTQDIQFGLDATAPDGWQVDVRPSGQSLASSVAVKAGESTTVNVDATPPQDTPAGEYEIDVTAAGGGYTATSQLVAKITGSYSMLLSTEDQRLNADVVAGKATDVTLVVLNTGSAPLENVQLSATAPSGWKTSFDPATIDVIAPGATAKATLTITPSNNAVAGDYRITLRSQTKQAQDSIELRSTVKTSTVWGLVGVGLIILVLAGLGVVFSRYGRR